MTTIETTGLAAVTGGVLPNDRLCKTELLGSAATTGAVAWLATGPAHKAQPRNRLFLTGAFAVGAAMLTSLSPHCDYI
jgi:hypothetical protein